MSKDPYTYSLKLLSKRDYSEFKLRQKLSSKFPDVDLEDTIIQLIEKRFLREEEYARIRVKSLILSGYSSSYIQMKLEDERLRVDNDFIHRVKIENGLQDSTTIASLIKKKMRYKTVPVSEDELLKLKHKLLNYLATKGHNLEESKDEIDRWLKTDECI